MIFRSLQKALTSSKGSTLCLLTNFACFCVIWGFFSEPTVSANSCRNTIIVSNSLDPDPVQAGHVAVPDWVQTDYKGYQQAKSSDSLTQISVRKKIKTV